jgi:hypothetical protein
MERGLQAFAWALAFVGGLAVVFPMADLLLTNLPWDLGRVEWRYQFTGRLSQTAINPLLGLTLVLGAAIVARRRALAKTVGFLASFGGLALLALTLLFVVDGSEARALVPPEGLAIFKLGGVRAIAKNVFSTGAFGVIAWAAFRAARGIRPRGSRGTAKETLFGAEDASA